MLRLSIRSLRTTSLLLSALAASALPALAGDATVTTSSKDKNPVIEKKAEAPRFYMSLVGGGELDTGVTDFTSNGAGNFSRIAPPIALVPGGVPLLGIFQSRDFADTHDVAVVNGRLELGYNVLPYLSVFTGFTYSHAGGNDRANVGTVIDQAGFFGPVGNRFDLLAGVGQYQAFAGMAGFKVHTPRTILDLLHLPQAIRPYLSVSAGGKYLDSQYVRFYTADPSIVDTGRLKLYDESWVFTTEAQLGYELQLTHCVSIIFENGYGYDTAPDHGNLGGNIGAVNRSGSRFYSTASLGAKITF